MNEIEKKFFEDNGFTVVGCDGLDLTDNNILAHVSTNILYRLGKVVDRPEAEAIFISCTGIDAMDAIEALEVGPREARRDLQPGVLVARLQDGEGGGTDQGYGRLFREPQVARTKDGVA